MWYALFGILVLIPAGIYLWLRNKLLTHLPDNWPDPARKQLGKQIIVCAGDSITHGNTGANYVDRLAETFAREPWQWVNAGRNADLTYTLLARLDEIIQLQPDVITVLIGTNDVNATMSQARLAEYRQIGKIARDVTPDFEQFQANYRQLTARLKTETNARIALASLPIMGEDLTHPANQRTDQYSLFIRQLCDENGFNYLPVREAMKTYLAQFPTERKHTYEQARTLLTISVARHYVLGHSWDRICTDHGNVLTQDMLHVNTAGATIIADIVGQFLINTKQTSVPQPSVS